MRRKDREVTDIQSIINIIDNCQCCRIGFQDEGEVYIVPLHFGFEYKSDRFVLYFHGADEGRKIDLIDKNPCVGFEMDTNHEIYANNHNGTACAYTARFQSVIGTGKISMVCDNNEKKHGMLLLMEHTVQKREWSFDEKMLNAVAVFKLEVYKFSCKKHD